MALTNRYDFVILFDVENGNPNGIGCRECTSGRCGIRIWIYYRCVSETEN